jgi:hypothetical protein
MMGSMAQTREGAIKQAAAKIGVTVEQYEQNTASGLKWCTVCREWQARAAFAVDRSRWDGLVSVCREAKNLREREQYVPSTAPRVKGRSFVPARDGDVKQARRRVNFFVETGLLPHPNNLPCADCGHVWKSGERRHEYDHHLGYDAAHHEDVEAVCTRCHHSRERDRLGPTPLA